MVVVMGLVGSVTTVISYQKCSALTTMWIQRRLVETPELGSKLSKLAAPERMARA